MKRGFAVICGLMLTISLAACGAEGEPSSAVSPAVSSPLEIENGGSPMRADGFKSRVKTVLSSSLS